MGVPAFFRWVHRKYPLIVVQCIEKAENDYSEKNPNGVEFDNLYIDMNGVIHPCTHPEDKPAPCTEDEMMISIFECIDRIFKIVRPRKIFYLAVDGVAPRAKMNQQRSRRFRAAKEAQEKAEQIRLRREKLKVKGVNLTPEKDKECAFDSNCITPGTEFMSNLTKCLNYYIHDRIANDVGWKHIKVILSDASVPGEGEHKIMDFIRRQRAHPDHDPNTHHCICGADADLLMLGLSTHEPYFTIIREEFIFKKTTICLNCGQSGHTLVECGCVSSKMEKLTNKFIFIRLNVLREYLEEELNMPGLSFEYNFERALDDWVFMCFFVGNDFLPHLPSLEIHEGAIDRLVKLYKKTISTTNGFITNNGDVNLCRLQMILAELGKLEDEIFKKRHNNEKKQGQRERNGKMQESTQTFFSNFRKIDVNNQTDSKDDIKLWLSGYKERYYKFKFNIDSDFNEYTKIAREYVIGLCWVLKYYYQGCTSWKWFYPYYFAPFASDFINISHTNVFFEKGKPFFPLEQLMGVFPAESSSLVPSTWAGLMRNPSSPIIDFYPKEFIVDLNGKRFAWQGVVLLPFVDESRLKKALSTVYKNLSEEEIGRNKCGHDRLYLGMQTDCFEYINNLDPLKYQKIKNPIISDGVYGDIYFIPNEFFQGETIPAPLEGLNCVYMNTTICVAYSNPQYPDGYVFKSSRLAGAREPPRVLHIKPKHETQSYTLSLINDKAYLGCNRDPCYQQTVASISCPPNGMVPLLNSASVSDTGHRMLSHALNYDYDNNNKSRSNQFVKKYNFNRFIPYH